MERGAERLMRVKNMIRNSSVSFLSQVLLIIAGFFSQRVLFLQAGRELAGLNSVISNILAILSVSELGISTAVVFHLYQALVRKKESEIAALMNLYRRAYVVFAIVITVFGLLVLPFVHVFLRHNSFSLYEIRVIYSMWLLRTVLSYLLSYKRSILIADQREYIVTIVTTTAGVLNYLLIIVIVGLTSAYIPALFANIVIEAVSNAGLSYYIGRRYPFLKKLRKEPLPFHMIRQIFGDLKNIFFMRIASRLLTCTDNLIISGLIDVGTAGVYSNYSLITQSVTNIVIALSNAVQPGIGVLFVEKNQEKNNRALRLLTFSFYFIAVTGAAGLNALMEPFITDLWLNEQSMPLRSAIVWCAVNCLIQTIGLPLTICMNVSGLFDKERRISMTGAFVNLAVSLGLARTFGITGVLAGTGCSYFVQLVLRTRCFFHDYLKRSCRSYLLELAEYACLAWAVIQAAGVIVDVVYGTGGFLRFLAAGICCVLFSVGTNLVFFCRSQRAVALYRIVRRRKY